MSKKYYYENKDFKLIQGDSLKILKEIEPKSIDMIFADPPYFCLVVKNGRKIFNESKSRILEKL